MSRVLGTLLVALTASTVHAHAIGVSRGDYTVEGASVLAALTFSRAELEPLPPLGEGVSLWADGRPCLASPAELTPTPEGDGLRLATRFDCGAAPRALRLALPLLAALSPGHRHLAHVDGTDAVLYEAAPTVEVTVAAPGPGALARAGQLVALGVEHILSGADHLIFLFGLLLVARRPGPVVKVITAFTLGHSVTLAVAATGAWTPGPDWVEPLIALSVAYVGIENLFRRSLDGRWRLTLAFGLVHGFGFAGALRELEVPRAQLVPALLAFNLGVELGQLAVLALALPLLLWARRSATFARYGTAGLSALIVVPGLVWFVQRVG